MRDVYVFAACRGRGIGWRLVAHAVAAARGHFHRLRLRGEEALRGSTIRSACRRTSFSGCQGLSPPVLVTGSHAFGRTNRVSPTPWPPAGLTSTPWPPAGLTSPLLQ